MNNSRGPGSIWPLAAGALAGAVGTVAMDLLLYRRYRDGGGKNSVWSWETAEGVTRWDGASAPGQVGQKLEKLLTRRPPPDDWARPTTNVVHWAMGIASGAQFGVVVSGLSGRWLLPTIALGPVVWLSGYVVLPLAGVYKPIWKYDARTLAKDLSAHLVYGAVTGTVFRALT